MAISVERCSPTSSALAAISKGLAVADVTADVRIVGDFVAVVRELTDSTTYGSDRGASVVAARTIPLPPGPVIVVNWPEAVRQDDAELERLLVHEGGHVLLDERGETPSDYRYLVDSGPDWLLMCLASYAIEEFRIEAGLARRGYPPAGVIAPDHIAHALAELNSQVVAAVVFDPDAGESNPEDMRTSTVAAQHVFANLLRYIAGASVDGPGFDVAVLVEPGALRHWDDYVSAGWADRTALYDSLPDAWTATNPGQWESTLLAGLAVERDFLAALGFSWRPQGDQQLLLRTGADGAFDDRLHRALADFPE